ncbi:hypothetical protein KFK09_010695 [Dendrobium nobile]|uniref:Uncharacterized protein n=1 Tax=Dendrobium nobile TaxID=94219 RepID=A0A8T3BDQ9_DENNO|nr:hypothetical protein KFK09_010695 [Dendrobium nobile]
MSLEDVTYSTYKFAQLQELRLPSVTAITFFFIQNILSRWEWILSSYFGNFTCCTLTQQHKQPSINEANKLGFKGSNSPLLHKKANPPTGSSKTAHRHNSARLVINRTQQATNHA